MGRITKLDDALANQIAAGEVVERPAAVVKELLENSIDAGARRVVVTTEYGGKTLIRVEDDGIGMDADDARLSLERHATSKIRTADDLAAILTLGFRGEALPSIASVSRFRLRTRARGAASGTEIRVSGGLVDGVVESGGPEGTLIEVADLFYNLPARRKFLKSDAAESAQISRLVTQLSLCYPQIGFTLTSAGRTVLQLPPVVELHERLFQLYGDRPDLVRVHREMHGYTLTGYAAALAEQGPVRGPQHVFVNRRIVRDRTIAHAIIDAYSVASIKERSPEVHLFLEIPPDRVDVNVHPTKAEVRFRDQSLVHELVRRGVGDALGRSPAPEMALEPWGAAGTRPSPQPAPQAIPGILAGGVFVNPWSGGTARDGGTAWSGGTAAGAAAPVEALGGLVFPANPAWTPTAGAGPAATGESVVGDRPLVALGQFRDTFIIAVDDDGIVIIDQHVAHERVLFEKIMAELTARPLESQRLLVPMLLELPPAARETLLGRREALAQAGFDLEEFGGDSVRVSAVPALLATADCDAALRALAEDLEGLDRGLRVEEALKQIAATMACHAAVKANDRLSAQQVGHILQGLRETAYSTICPHGRPVLLRLSRRELEKRFERT